MGGWRSEDERKRADESCPSNWLPLRCTVVKPEAPGVPRLGWAAHDMTSLWQRATCGAAAPPPPPPPPAHACALNFTHWHRLADTKAKTGSDSITARKQ